jgi:putative transposase
MWSQERTVTKTATVSLHGNTYEVDAALVGRKVELVFDPFDLSRIEVRYQHRPFGLAVPLVIGRYTHPQAERELPPPPAPTGIDYLKILAEQRDAEIAGHPIDFASLTQPDGDGDGDGDGEDRDINVEGREG